MATYVLVPGSWAGAWIWRPTARALQRAGHEVFAVTLTGLGERSHLISPQITLSTHITDVVNTLRFEQLEDVILVGHSYGAVVITGVAEQVPERLAQLVYIDGFLPADGQSMWDVLGADIRAMLQERTRNLVGEWLLPFNPPDGPDTHRRTPMSTTVFGDRIAIGNPQAAAIPRTFIACTQTPAELGEISRGITAAADCVRDDPAWQYHEIPSGHSPMETMPNELAELLLEPAMAATEVSHG